MTKLIIRALSTLAALGVLIAAASATPAHAKLECGGMHGCWRMEMSQLAPTGPVANRCADFTSSWRSAEQRASPTQQ
jgi:hypothetical protein